MKRRTIILFFIVICLCAGSVVLWYISAPSKTQKAIQQVLDDPTTQQKNLPDGLDEFIAWYVPRVKNASPEVRALMKQFDADFRGSGGIQMELENLFPTDEWLQRYVDMGINISDYSDYSGALNLRWMLYRAKTDPAEFAEDLERRGLPSNAPFEALITAEIRFYAQLDERVAQAEKDDPLVYGGSMGQDGVFTPIRYKTVYVSVDESGGSMSAGSGVPRWVIDAIKNREMGLPSKEIPEDITVIYLDEKGNPIPPKEAEITPPKPPSERSPTAEREQTGVSTSEDNGAGQTGETEQPPSVTGSPPDRAMPPKPEPLTFDELPKSDADWERFLSESPLSELENRLSEDGLQDLAKTLTQYGVEEGLKRIEAKDPALAEQVRQRMTRNKRANQRRTTTPVKPVQAGHENGGKQ